MYILITGANGFIGKTLCKIMIAEGWQVRGTVRSSKSLTTLPSGVNGLKISSIDAETNWTEALTGVDTVVHLAARVHVMKDSVSSPFDEYRKVDVQGSQRLALAAAECGVKRFIFMTKTTQGRLFETFHTVDRY